MPSIIEVELINRLNWVLDSYIRSFRSIFQTAPDITDEDKAAVRRLLGRVKMDKTQIERLCSEYFLLEDEWLKNNGFQLRFIESRYNAIMARCADIKGFKRHYVIAINEIGRPQIDHNPNAMGKDFWFKPVLWNEWLKSPDEKRLCISKERHLKAGNNLDRWVENWREWEKEWTLYEGE